MPEWLMWTLLTFVVIVLVCEIFPVDRWIDRWEQWMDDRWP